MTRSQSSAETRPHLTGIKDRCLGVDAVDFELWCTAVSAINGCGECVESHEKMLRDKAIREETIVAAVRIASVIHGLASILDAERAIAPAPVLV